MRKARSARRFRRPWTLQPVGRQRRVAQPGPQVQDGPSSQISGSRSARVPEMQCSGRAGRFALYLHVPAVQAATRRMGRAESGAPAAPQRRGWIPVLHRQAVAAFQRRFILKPAQDDVLQSPGPQRAVRPRTRLQVTSSPTKSPHAQGRRGNCSETYRLSGGSASRTTSGRRRAHRRAPKGFRGRESAGRPSDQTTGGVLFSDPGNPPFPHCLLGQAPSSPVRTRAQGDPVFGGRSGQRNTTILRKGGRLPARLILPNLGGNPGLIAWGDPPADPGPDSAARAG